MCETYSATVIVLAFQDLKWYLSQDKEEKDAPEGDEASAGTPVLALGRAVTTSGSPMLFHRN